MKLSIFLFLLSFFSIVSVSNVEAKMSKKTPTKYEVIVKELLVKRALRKENENIKAYDYIQKIMNQALTLIKEKRSSEELDNCISSFKDKLAKKNIHISEEELVETLVKVVNS
jgi:predicted DNA-binding protein (UPF0278 family)